MRRNKLECLYLVVFQTSLVIESVATAYPSEALLFMGGLLALPPNIRLAWKKLPQTYSLAYFAPTVTDEEKKRFYKINVWKAEGPTVPATKVFNGASRRQRRFDTDVDVEPSKSILRRRGCHRLFSPLEGSQSTIKSIIEPICERPLRPTALINPLLVQRLMIEWIFDMTPSSWTWVASFYQCSSLPS